MKNAKLLNPAIVSAVARLGHTQFLVIADAGLPIPAGVPVIDISVARNLPGFMDVLCAVEQEMVIESFFYAEEMITENQPLHEQLLCTLGDVLHQAVTHQAFKALLAQANAVIRTGECSKYANVALVGGTDF